VTDSLPQTFSGVLRSELICQTCGHKYSLTNFMSGCPSLSAGEASTNRSWTSLSASKRSSQTPLQWRPPLQRPQQRPSPSRGLVKAEEDGRERRKSELSHERGSHWSIASRGSPLLRTCSTLWWGFSSLCSDLLLPCLALPCPTLPCPTLPCCLNRSARSVECRAALRKS
jgi:hypothetical protein